ncbi:MAG: LamG domain-containing protein [Lewinellaceae bacterium]|nr:LamG domain-containing protein [Lewinellaceae bacterium]
MGLLAVAAPAVFNLTADIWRRALVKSATTLEVYINGVLVQTTPWIGTIAYSSQFLRLGRWGSGGRNWNGSMDDVRIWNTARTCDEINQPELRD